MGARGLVIRDDLDAAALRRFAQADPDRRAALRALAVAQALEGASRAEAGRVTGRERQSLRDAVARYVEPGGSPGNAEGLAGLHDRAQPRRREKLDVAQQEAPRAWVLQGPDPERDGPSSHRLLDIAAHVANSAGVCPTRWPPSRGYCIAWRLSASAAQPWQKARPAHPEGSAEARELHRKPRRRAGRGRHGSPWHAAPGLVRGWSSARGA